MASTLLSGLVAGWKMEDTSEVLGTYPLTNNGSVTFTSGKILNAATYSDNTGQSLTRASLPFGAAGTIAMWVFVNSGDDGGYLFDSSSANRYYCYYVGDGSMSMSLRGSAALNLAAGSLVFNQWNLFIVEWDNALVGNEIKAYINNSLINQVSTGIAGSTPSTFYIGNRFSNTGTQDSMNGKIDEVYFWNRALTIPEKTELYKGGVGNTYPFPDVSPSNFFQFF